MKLKTIACGPIGTNCYILSNKKGKCLIFDAPPESYEKVTRFLKQENLTPLALILTHGHWDHLLDAWRFREDSIPLIAHPEGAPLISDPHFMSLFAPEGLEFHCADIDTLMEQGSLNLGDFKLDFFYVPGHCPGSLAIYCAEAKLCITGDLIFHGSVGRTDLPGGDFSLLSKSIQECIFTLPGETILLPGHGPETTVDYEKSNNPYI